MKIFLGIVILTYLVYSCWIIIKMWKSTTLTKNRKIANTILIIFIPFIWGLIVSIIIKPPPIGFVDHSDEIDKERNTSYVSSVGIFGSSSGWSEHINGGEKPKYYDEHGNEIK